MKDLGNDKYSEEFLNALVDGEFSAEERASLLHRLHDDPQATKDYCQIRSIKEMVQTAYQPSDNPLANGMIEAKKNKSWMLSTLAASVIAVAVIVTLVFSVAVDREIFNSPALERFALLDPAGRGKHAARSADEETRIVFHVVNSSRTNGGSLLTEVENVLKDYQSRNLKLRVEVVAHSAGLDLLRTNLTKEKKRIKQLSQDFPNLTFVACRNTVDRIAISEGLEVLLLPEAELTESGVAHVVQRQREGWIYIQV